MGESEVIDHQPAGLFAKDAVYASDRLHEPVAAHGLVDIHGVERRRVEAGQPHVANDGDLEWIGGIVKPFSKFLSPGLVSDVHLPLRRVGGRASHHNFDHALLVIIVMPLRPQLDNFPVNLHTDPPAHADDHRLAFVLGLAQHRFRPRFEVFDDILGDEPNALLCADHGFQLRPLGFELFFPVDFFAFGRFLEFRVDLGLLSFVEFEFGHATFVVDRYGGLVFDSAQNIVDGDVIAEDRAGVLVGCRWAFR